MSERIGQSATEACDEACSAAHHEEPQVKWSCSLCEERCTSEHCPIGADSLRAEVVRLRERNELLEVEVDGLRIGESPELQDVRLKLATAEGEVCRLREERDKAQGSLESVAWPKTIPAIEGEPDISAHFRSMAARIVQSRDELKHENRKLRERAEAAESRIAALSTALENIAAHDGERWIWGEDGLPVSQSTPQEIAQAALAALIGAGAEPPPAGDGV